MLDVLKSEHDRMRALLSELDAILVQDTAPIDGRLPSLRWALAREHLLHSKREGVVIGQLFGQAAASAHAHASGALDDLVTRQVRDWDAASIARSWDRYCQNTRALIRRLRWQMDEEDRALARPPRAPGHGNSSDASP